MLGRLLTDAAADQLSMPLSMPLYNHQGARFGTLTRLPKMGVFSVWTCEARVLKSGVGSERRPSP